MLPLSSPAIQTSRHRLMAWLGLLALLFHSLLPLAYHSLQQRNAADAGFDSIVICTVYGMRTIQIGADGQPLAADQTADPSSDDQSGKQTAARYCPICLGAQQGVAILAALPMLAMPAMLEILRHSVWSAAPPPELTQHRPHARGPPTSL